MKDDKSIYSKAVTFAVVATITVLIGTIVTVFVPMFTKGMHPKLDNLKPFTALELAGRDLYQKEGCINCHSQTVRPLKADVLRYGPYSKAGEFAYDRPFLWGSKRTGPDLARIGGKYPDEWHIQHFENPQAFYPKSNMPKYTWFSDRKVNVKATLAAMNALGFPYSDEEAKELAEATEMDAMVAYMQVLGTSVEKEPVITVSAEDVEEVNPYNGDEEAIKLGRELYVAECAGCHGQNAEGNIGMSLVEYASYGVEDSYTYSTIANGLEGVMPGFASKFSKEETWAIVAYMNSLK